MNWYKQSGTADDAAKMFEGMAGGFTSGAESKIQEYAEAVLANKRTNPSWTWQQAYDQMVQDKGIQGMPQLRSRIALKAQELGQGQQAVVKQQPQLAPKLMEYVQRIQSGGYRNEILQGLPVSWQQQILGYLKQQQEEGR